MFNGATTFDSDISSWDVSSVYNMRSMFDKANSFNQNINTKSVTVGGVTYNAWDVISLSDMSNMFRDADLFNQPLNNWDTNQVTSLDRVFLNAPSFNQDVSSWDVSIVTDAVDMFNGATSFSVSNYDLLLGGWSAQTVTPNVILGVQSTQFSSGAPTTARGILTSAPNNWVITDGGQV
jgi:surface protein